MQGASPLFYHHLLFLFQQQWSYSIGFLAFLSGRIILFSFLPPCNKDAIQHSRATLEDLPSESVRETIPCKVARAEAGPWLVRLDTKEHTCLDCLCPLNAILARATSSKARPEDRGDRSTGGKTDSWTPHRIALSTLCANMEPLI